MLGELTREEIEHVLHGEIVGRIGCGAEGRIYVVPVSYVYDGEHVYGHASDGLKIRTMRANPSVCFEVEQIDDLANWRTVVAMGHYEELAGSEEERARGLLAARFRPRVTSASAEPASGSGPASRAIYYRIRLVEKTGRYEKR